MIMSAGVGQARDVHGGAVPLWLSCATRQH